VRVTLHSKLVFRACHPAIPSCAVSPNSDGQRAFCNNGQFYTSNAEFPMTIENNSSIYLPNNGTDYEDLTSSLYYELMPPDQFMVRY
jgi:hypothetical protein